MSDLNKLKELAKKYPNNQDFGAVIRGYLLANKTCCDKAENIKSFEDLNSHPYGLDVSGTKCKECGKVIDCKIVR